MRAFGGMQNRQPMVRGAYRGLLAKRTAPTLRQVLNADFFEKLLQKPELADNLVE
jgi:hypothetical protein